ncbi:MAG: hypothetical protein UV40_C0021G0024 [Parcubacteria group bacterium GW2011_GWA1_42_7]|nr:MAG: hypothetical protein UV40_C0021G0024 [Parcubacteria group bacterium GW2011_GWA1_42_7]KKS91448.1 MAG: hypothetical protein UV67_C0027G0009 [Parcubacteria group bacterium GW2011_GWC1_43_12]
MNGIIEMIGFAWDCFFVYFLICIILASILFLVFIATQQKDENHKQNEQYLECFIDFFDFDPYKASNKQRRQIRLDAAFLVRFQNLKRYSMCLKFKYTANKFNMYGSFGLAARETIREIKDMMGLAAKFGLKPSLQVVNTYSKIEKELGELEFAGKEGLQKKG